MKDLKRVLLLAGGASNTGTIDDNSEIGAEAPTKVANGACEFLD